jgi:hypothetical protein
MLKSGFTMRQTRAADAPRRLEPFWRGGAEWMTFDLPRASVAAMARAMERPVNEVKPAAA